MSDQKKRIRNDILLILAIALAALAVCCGVNFTRRQGAYVVVSVDGRDVAVYPLDTDIRVELETYHDGRNTIVIKEGCACIESASCPDLLCVKQRTIRYVGETITCLPNRLVIRIEGEGGVDAVQ